MGVKNLKKQINIFIIIFSIINIMPRAFSVQNKSLNSTLALSSNCKVVLEVCKEKQIEKNILNNIQNNDTKYISFNKLALDEEWSQEVKNIHNIIFNLLPELEENKKIDINFVRRFYTEKIAEVCKENKEIENVLIYQLKSSVWYFNNNVAKKKNRKRSHNRSKTELTSKTRNTVQIRRVKTGGEVEDEMHIPCHNVDALYKAIKAKAGNNKDSDQKRYIALVLNEEDYYVEKISNAWEEDRAKYLNDIEVVVKVKNEVDESARVEKEIEEKSQKLLFLSKGDSFTDFEDKLIEYKQKGFFYKNLYKQNKICSIAWFGHENFNLDAFKKDEFKDNMDELKLFDEIFATNNILLKECKEKCNTSTENLYKNILKKISHELFIKWEKIYEDVDQNDKFKIQRMRASRNMIDKVKEFVNASGWVKDEEVLGKGAFGTAYRAKDRRYVVKEIPNSYPEVIAVFMEYLKLLFAGYENEKVVEVFALIPMKRNTQIITKYCDESLDKYIKSDHFNISQFFIIMKLVLKGLKEMHKQGIVHYDLKEDNVFINFAKTDKGEIDKNIIKSVKIGDFGVVLLNKSRFNFVGTNGYAFSVYDNFKRIKDHSKDDVFAAFNIMYKILNKEHDETFVDKMMEEQFNKFESIKYKIEEYHNLMELYVLFKKIENYSKEENKAVCLYSKMDEDDVRRKKTVNKKDNNVYGNEGKYELIIKSVERIRKMFNKNKKNSDFVKLIDKEIKKNKKSIDVNQTIQSIKKIFVEQLSQKDQYNEDEVVKNIENKLNESVRESNTTFKKMFGDNSKFIKGLKYFEYNNTNSLENLDNTVLELKRGLDDELKDKFNWLYENFIKAGGYKKKFDEDNIEELIKEEKFIDKDFVNGNSILRKEFAELAKYMASPDPVKRIDIVTSEKLFNEFESKYKLYKEIESKKLLNNEGEEIKKYFKAKLKDKNAEIPEKIKPKLSNHRKNNLYSIAWFAHEKNDLDAFKIENFDNIKELELYDEVYASYKVMQEECIKSCNEANKEYYEKFLKHMSEDLNKKAKDLYKEIDKNDKFKVQRMCALKQDILNLKNLHNVINWESDYENKLGKGSFGIVYSGKVDKDIAVKEISFVLLDKQVRENKSYNENTREVKLLKSVNERLRHVSACFNNPHVNQIKTAICKDNKVKFILKKGVETLFTYMENFDHKPIKMDKKEFIIVSNSIFECFEILHERGIVYSDLKPENILLKRDKRDNIIGVELIDFGGGVSNGYRSPESAGENKINEKHDIFTIFNLMALMLGSPRTFIEKIYEDDYEDLNFLMKLQDENIEISEEIELYKDILSKIYDNDKVEESEEEEEDDPTIVIHNQDKSEKKIYKELLDRLKKEKKQVFIDKSTEEEDNYLAKIKSILKEKGKGIRNVEDCKEHIAFLEKIQKELSDDFKGLFGKVFDDEWEGNRYQKNELKEMLYPALMKKYSKDFKEIPDDLINDFFQQKLIFKDDQLKKILKELMKAMAHPDPEKRGDIIESKNMFEECTRIYASQIGLIPGEENFWNKKEQYVIIKQNKQKFWDELKGENKVKVLSKDYIKNIEKDLYMSKLVESKNILEQDNKIWRFIPILRSSKKQELIEKEEEIIAKEKEEGLTLLRLTKKGSELFPIFNKDNFNDPRELKIYDLVLTTVSELTKEIMEGKKYELSLLQRILTEKIDTVYEYIRSEEYVKQRKEFLMNLIKTMPKLHLVENYNDIALKSLGNKGSGNNGDYRVYKDGRAVGEKKSNRNVEQDDKNKLIFEFINMILAGTSGVRPYALIPIVSGKGYRIVMEYYKDGDLKIGNIDKVLNLNAKKLNTLSAKRKREKIIEIKKYLDNKTLCMELFKKLSVLLSGLHEKGLAHGDFKADNIVIKFKRDVNDKIIGIEDVKLIDLDPNTKGTAFINDYQVHLFKAKVSKESDVFALSNVLFFLLTGGEQKLLLDAIFESNKNYKELSKEMSKEMSNEMNYLYKKYLGYIYYKNKLSYDKELKQEVEKQKEDQNTGLLGRCHRYISSLTNRLKDSISDCDSLDSCDEETKYDSFEKYYAKRDNHADDFKQYEKCVDFEVAIGLDNIEFIEFLIDKIELNQKVMKMLPDWVVKEEDGKKTFTDAGINLLDILLEGISFYRESRPDAEEFSMDIEYIKNEFDDNGKAFKKAA